MRRVAAGKARSSSRTARRLGVHSVSDALPATEIVTLSRRSGAASVSDTVGGQRICVEAVSGPPFLKADNDRTQSIHGREIG